MARYSVKFYKGDYSARQRAANADNAVCYIEQHFNSASDPKADYTHAKVATNASNTSKEMAKFYARRVAREFGTELMFGNGLDAGGRGNGNLRLTKMPAILLEPLFVSNPAQSLIVKSVAGQARLAQCLVDTVMHFFPKGGLVALSVGHRYKRSHPSDRGASVVGGGNEADYAEKVLQKAAELLAPQDTCEG